MKNKHFTKSEDSFKLEYCASVVRIGELKPIEGSDFLAKTLVNGFSIVVRKDEFTEGELAFYAPIETQLNEDFLKANNLFDLSNYDKNANAVEVAKNKVQIESLKGKLERLKKEGNEEEVEATERALEDLQNATRGMCGFFTHTRRVKLINLRKTPSMGFLFKLTTLMKWKPELADVNMDEIEGEDFDTVDGELFIKAYVPYVPESNRRGGRRNRTIKNKQFELLEEGQYTTHYDTQQLNRSMNRFDPDTEVAISVKIHGSLGQYSRVLVRRPHDFGNKLFNKVYRWIVPEKWQKMDRNYEFVYGSHRVIKNKDINPAADNGGFYGTDIWEKYVPILKPYIEDGMVVYGEIFGYIDNEKMVQKEYDYGCEPGTSRYMPYRIYQNNPDGTKREWEVTEVRDWTLDLIEKHPELKEHLFPIDIIYVGKLGDLYQKVDRETHWHENVLEEMKKEKLFFMEKNEPLCKYHKVPREGIVIRIMNDPIAEAFKLKCLNFLKRERDLVTEGEVDVEMAENFM